MSSPEQVYLVACGIDVRHNLKSPSLGHILWRCRDTLCMDGKMTHPISEVVEDADSC